MDWIDGNLSRCGGKPFNAGYLWNNTAANEVIVDPTISIQNTFTGSATQQATSVVTNTDVLAYEYSGGLYEIYGYEYKPGFDDAVSFFCQSFVFL